MRKLLFIALLALSANVSAQGFWIPSVTHEKVNGKHIFKKTDFKEVMKYYMYQDMKIKPEAKETYRITRSGNAVKNITISTEKDFWDFVNLHANVYLGRWKNGEYADLIDLGDKLIIKQDGVVVETLLIQ